MLLKNGILWENTCQIPLCGRQIVKWVTWNYSWRNASSKEFYSQLWEVLLFWFPTWAPGCSLAYFSLLGVLQLRDICKLLNKVNFAYCQFWETSSRNLKLLGAFILVSHLIFKTTLRGKYNHTHFIEEETERFITCPRSQSYWKTTYHCMIWERIWCICWNFICSNNNRKNQAKTSQKPKLNPTKWEWYLFYQNSLGTTFIVFFHVRLTLYYDVATKRDGTAQVKSVDSVS